MVANMTPSTTAVASLKSTATAGGISSAPLILWADGVTSYFFNVPFPVLFAAFFGAMIMLARQQPVTKTKMTSFFFGTISVVASAATSAFVTPLLAVKYDLGTNVWLGTAFIVGMLAQGLLPNLAEISKTVATSSGDIGNTFVEAIKKRIMSFIGGGQ